MGRGLSENSSLSKIISIELFLLKRGNVWFRKRASSFPERVFDLPARSITSVAVGTDEIDFPVDVILIPFKGKVKTVPITTGGALVNLSLKGNRFDLFNGTHFHRLYSLRVCEG